MFATVCVGKSTACAHNIAQIIDACDNAKQKQVQHGYT